MRNLFKKNNKNLLFNSKLNIKYKFIIEMFLKIAKIKINQLNL